MKRYIQRLRVAADKYGAIAKINCMNKIAYPVDFIMDVVFLLFIFLILFFLYRVTITVKPASPVEQLSLTQILWIVFFVPMFLQMSAVRAFLIW